MKTFFIFAPIISLLLVGLFISLKSTDGNSDSAWSIKALARTVSSIFVELIAYLLVFLGLQSVVGFPVRLLIGF